MKYAFRLLLLWAVAAIAGIGMSCLIASSTKNERGGLAHSFLFESRRSEAIERRTRQVFQAMQVKQNIIDDLIAKRRTLREAVVGFRQADELIEDHHSNLMTKFIKVETERELYQQILRWTQIKLHDDPSQAEAVRQRLESMG